MVNCISELLEFAKFVLNGEAPVDI